MIKTRRRKIFLQESRVLSAMFFRMIQNWAPVGICHARVRDGGLSIQTDTVTAHREVPPVGIRTMILLLSFCNLQNHKFEPYRL